MACPNKPQQPSKTIIPPQVSSSIPTQQKSVIEGAEQQPNQSFDMTFDDMVAEAKNKNGDDCCPLPRSIMNSQCTTQTNKTGSEDKSIGSIEIVFSASSRTTSGEEDFVGMNEEKLVAAPTPAENWIVSGSVSTFLSEVDVSKSDENYNDATSLVSTEEQKEVEVDDGSCDDNLIDLALIESKLLDDEGRAARQRCLFLLNAPRVYLRQTDPINIQGTNAIKSPSRETSIMSDLPCDDKPCSRGNKEGITYDVPSMSYTQLMPSAQREGTSILEGGDFNDALTILRSLKLLQVFIKRHVNSVNQAVRKERRKKEKALQRHLWIQSVTQRVLARRQSLCERKSALSIQRCWRGFETRRNLSTSLDHASKAIQCAQRSYLVGMRE